MQYHNLTVSHNIKKSKLMAKSSKKHENLLLQKKHENLAIENGTQKLCCIIFRSIYLWKSVLGVACFVKVVPNWYRCFYAHYKLTKSSDLTGKVLGKFISILREAKAKTKE